jgi:hypothetical protein
MEGLPMMLFLLMVVVANAAASMYLWKRKETPVAQRQLQLLLVWALPVVGALLCVIAVSMTRASDGVVTDPRPRFDAEGSVHDGEIRHDYTDCATDSSCDGGGGDGGGGSD